MTPEPCIDATQQASRCSVRPAGRSAAQHRHAATQRTALVAQLATPLRCAQDAPAPDGDALPPSVAAAALAAAAAVPDGDKRSRSLNVQSLTSSDANVTTTATTTTTTAAAAAAATTTSTEHATATTSSAIATITSSISVPRHPPALPLRSHHVPAAAQTSCDAMLRKMSEQHATRPEPPRPSCHHRPRPPLPSPPPVTAITTPLAATPLQRRVRAPPPTPSCSLASLHVADSERLPRLAFRIRQVHVIAA